MSRRRSHSPRSQEVGMSQFINVKIIILMCYTVYFDFIEYFDTLSKLRVCNRRWCIKIHV